MTTKLAPDSPPLEMDGEVAAKPGETIADSSWPELPDEEGPKQESLRRIAKAQKGKKK